MFKRVQIPEWQEILPIIAFAISFLIFLFIVIRALRMRREKIRHMANLPLENDEKPSNDGQEERSQ